MAAPGCRTIDIDSSFAGVGLVCSALNNLLEPLP